MLQPKNNWSRLFLLAFTVLLANACGGGRSAETNLTADSVAPAQPIASDATANDEAIRFFENRLKKDPEDFSANNKLAGLYLQKVRETGNAQYLALATRAANISLKSVPEARNAGGLAALALSEFAAHEFVRAKEHALRLAELDSSKSYPQGILGDVLIELGEYDAAEAAYKKIPLLDGGASDGSETRFARLAQIKGDNAGAQKHLATALALALNQPVPPRETVAWIRWQLGETAFATGDYAGAEKNYRDSLTTFPDHYRAVASLGKARYAQNDLPGAIEQYEKATRLLPDPQFIHALGDLYGLAGRADDAERQYELVEQIGHLSDLSGAPYNRQLALFYADHDIKTDEGYRLGAKEYEARKDIYGADALAWTALKAGKIAEAQTAMKNALRLGTQDARLLYHAGMIEKTAGNNGQAAKYLQNALQLNPAFDPLQSEKARAALEQLR